MQKPPSPRRWSHLMFTSSRSKYGRSGRFSAICATHCSSWAASCGWVGATTGASCVSEICADDGGKAPRARREGWNARRPARLNARDASGNVRDDRPTRRRRAFDPRRTRRARNARARGRGYRTHHRGAVQIRRAARALPPTLVRRDARGGVHASALARFAFVVRVDRSLVVSARCVLATPCHSAHPTHQNAETGTPHSGRERGGDEFNSSSDGLISSTRRIESSSVRADTDSIFRTAEFRGAGQLARSLAMSRVAASPRGAPARLTPRAPSTRRRSAGDGIEGVPRDDRTVVRFWHLWG